MESKGLGTFGTDIFTPLAPLDIPNRAWTVSGGGGGNIQKNQTGEKVKNYLLSIYYRNSDAQDVDETLQAFEELINSKGCEELTGFDTIELEATSFPSDQDLDNEERTVGLVQVTITVYSRDWLTPPLALQ